MAGGGQQRVGEIGRGRLAVGAGDADDGELARGELVPGGGQIGQRCSSVCDLDDGEIGGVADQLVHLGVVIVLHDHGARAGVAGLNEEVVTVGAEAGDGDEAVAGPDRAGVLTNRRDQRVSVASDQPVRSVGEQGGEWLRRHGGMFLLRRLGAVGALVAAWERPPRRAAGSAAKG